MEVIKVVVGQLQTNSYIVYDEVSKESILVDPGADFKTIDNVLQNLDTKLKYIVITHAHGDHIGAVNEVKEHYGVPIAVHAADAVRLSKAELNLSNMIFGYDVEAVADIELHEGDVLKLGDFGIEVIHTPGHTEGGICLLFDTQLISGDTLFKNSIGRTDLVGGSYEAIIDSLNNKLMKLDDYVIVYPGHGQSTTIGIERASNPYVA